MPELSREIETAIHLAREAGAIIMQIYGTDFAVAYKGVGDPVTEADKRANELIVDGLGKRFPGDGIVAEESPRPATGLTTSRVWYVDPMDGTREFIAKNGEFSVMIGLAIEGRSCLGIVYRPDKDLLFGGIADREAWVEERHVRRLFSVSNRTDPGSLRLVVSRSHRHPRMDAVRESIGIRQEMRCGSVGLKIALIANGDADLYIEPAPFTSTWDTCAPEAIMKGAGGRFTDLLGSPLVYGSGDMKNRKGLVASNGVCHDRVIAAIAPIAREILLKQRPE